MKVDVYLARPNSSSGYVSVRSRETEDYGTVVARRDKVTVVDAEFVIQEGRQQTCRETGIKNVHALVRGKWNDAEKVLAGEPITYNPDKYDRFVHRETEKPVTNASRATVTTKGVFARDLTYYG